MNVLRLTTTRLELVAGTVALAKAEIDDLPTLARLLDVPPPTHWPPPLNDERSQKFFLDSLLNAAPTHAGWYLWYCLRREPRALLGSAGFKGIPANGLVEIGYSMLEEHQRNGYCTEAVRALIGWAFRHPDVNMVIAHTLPDLLPSIRVMEKCGLAFAGNGPLEDGMQTVRYELTRKSFQQMRH
jgi:[ribosomal protein S5]-alanine N-acetyltransferase